MFHRILCSLIIAQVLVFGQWVDEQVGPCGMRVETFRDSPQGVTVITTGARILFATDGAIVGYSRFAADREVYRIEGIGGGRWRLGGYSGASARMRNRAAQATVTGDGVVVISPRRGASLEATVPFRSEWDAQKGGRRTILDEQGGCGFYPSRVQESASEIIRASGAGAVEPISYEIAAGDELWAAIYPCREPDDRYLGHRLAHEGKPFPIPDGNYPSEDIIRAAGKVCQVFCVHAYFWTDVPEDRKPKTGKYAGRQTPWLTEKHVPSDMDRFSRMRDEVKAAGMKFVVYLSPYYSKAPDILKEIQRVVDTYQIDGVYFDGTSMDFRKSYRIIRGARKILGPDRLLYVHASTDPFGSNVLHAPFLDAWCDFVLRGESGRGDAPADKVLRYSVSGWNTSGAIGVWCHYGSPISPTTNGTAPSVAGQDAACAAHVRLWRRSGWGDDPVMQSFEGTYGDRFAALVSAERTSLASARAERRRRAYEHLEPFKDKATGK